MATVLTAIIHKENDLYVAQCPEVGTASQGESIEEAVANLQEATELYLEEFPLQQGMENSLVSTLRAGKKPRRSASYLHDLQ